MGLKLKPLEDRVVVEPKKADDKTASGIILPDTAQEKPQEGEVVAAGNGTLKENGTIVPLEIKTGDKILFAKWSGTEVKVNGEELIIMKESDILATIEQ